MPLVVTSSPNKDITKLVVYMSLFEQEDMVVLHKFLRAFHCKTLMGMSFSKIPIPDQDHEYLFVNCSLPSLLSFDLVFLFLGIMVKFGYNSIKKAQAKKAAKAKTMKVQADKAKVKQQDHINDQVPPPPPISLGVVERANPGPQDEGPSKRLRVELVPLVVTSSIESHPVLLSMKEETVSLQGKDFNPSALIQSSMFSQLDHNMLKGVGPHVDGLHCLFHDKNLGNC